ncbi:tripartite tricarboxylate transporter TctB family protein [Natronococcus occultus]|uniref:Tripartite tricarboxylate transporter TctB family n=1 Tax=Natronococcus occultus SP4 TaxID=694430 RepID=L0K175_9EURY|nr:tripartite tricarboxylate transporter TctB family protein [Natronococcus occultus]AGB39062.1 Tripartite tricarboxylate transporter TctB family [Natronococcus occultus SP4]
MAVTLPHTDKIGSILWLLLAVGVFVASADLPTGTGETGAAFYPRVIAVLIAGFATLQLARSVYEEELQTRTLSREQARPVLAVVALVTVYVLSLPWFGFVAGTILFLVVGMLYSGARSPIPIGVAAVGLALLLYYVFAVFLRIPLPESPFVPVEDMLPGLIRLGLTTGVFG